MKKVFAILFVANLCCSLIYGQEKPVVLDQQLRNDYIRYSDLKTDDSTNIGIARDMLEGVRVKYKGQENDADIKIIIQGDENQLKLTKESLMIADSGMKAVEEPIKKIIRNAKGPVVWRSQPNPGLASVRTETYAILNDRVVMTPTLEDISGERPK